MAPRISPVTSSTLASSTTTGWPWSGSIAGPVGGGPDHHLDRVGHPVELAGAGAEAAGGDLHGRHRPPPGAQGGQQRRARRRGQLARDGGPVGRRARAAARPRPGPGSGSVPWAVWTIPVPWATGLARTSSTPSISRATQVPTMSMMASVAADLVEVDLGRRPAVEPALHLGQPGEGGQRPLAGPVGQAGLGDQPDDVGVGAHHLGVGRVHPDVGARQPGPQDRLGLEGPAADGQGDQLAFDQGQVGAGVDQAAEGHVAGDAGEAVPPGDGRHDRPGCLTADPRGPGCGRRRRRHRSRCRCRPPPARTRTRPAWPAGRSPRPAAP